MQTIDMVLKEQEDPFNDLDLTDLINQTEVGKEMQVPVNTVTPQLGQKSEPQPTAVADLPKQRTDALKALLLYHIVVCMSLFMHN